MPKKFAGKQIKKAVRAEIRRDLKQPKKQPTARVVKPKKKKMTKWGKIFRETGANLGGFFGMSGLGEKGGALVSRIFGQGDYNMAGQNLSSMPPTFAPLGTGFRIAHREYLTDIVGSTAFQSVTYHINPGLEFTFPWLSSVAANFEEYRIHGMVVYLKTNSATAVSSTNTALGVWGVVTQYEVTDPDFITKQQCENYTGCSSSVPSCSVLHAVECKINANVLKKFFVRTDEVTDDQKFYDMGKFQVFTQGMQAASNIGELWISYDVEFTKPRLPVGGAQAFTDTYSNTAVSSGLPLATASLLNPTSGTIGTNVQVSGSNNRINFPAGAVPGTYLIAIGWSSSASTTTTLPTVTYSGGVSAVNYWAVSGGSKVAYYTAPAAGTITTAAVMLLAIQCTGFAGYIQFSSGGTIPLTNIMMTMSITLISPLALNLKPPENKLLPNEISQFREFIDKFQSSLQVGDLDPPEGDLDDSYDISCVDKHKRDLKKLRYKMEKYLGRQLSDDPGNL
jgi:hypothetical protein